MNNEFKSLMEKFEIIKSKGWIESNSHGRGSVGITFEKELGLVPNKSEKPDFGNIEIKTKINNQFQYITLFSSTFDGPFDFEMKRISDKYGFYDNICTNSKVFYGIVQTNSFTKIGKNWKMTLDVDYIQKKIYLVICDNKNNIIDKQSFWSFDLLKKRLETKLNFLAFIYAKKKFEHNKIYFYYHDIKLYKLKNFETFLLLINNGEIRVSFKVGVYRTGPKIGEYYDHGTGFEINKDDINKLFYNL